MTSPQLILLNFSNEFYWTWLWIFLNFFLNQTWFFFFWIFRCNFIKLDCWFICYIILISSDLVTDFLECSITFHQTWSLICLNFSNLFYQTWLLVKVNILLHFIRLIFKDLVVESLEYFVMILLNFVTDYH